MVWVKGVVVVGREVGTRDGCRNPPARHPRARVSSWSLDAFFSLESEFLRYRWMLDSSSCRSGRCASSEQATLPLGFAVV